jgi:hypothetical protein
VNKTGTNTIVDPTWTQIQAQTLTVHRAFPDLAAEYLLRQGADDRGGARIGLLRPSSIDPQQNRGIMAAACGHNMNRNASVEQQGFVSAAEIMEP